VTPAEIKKTRLYRTLAPCVRKEDREELARMLAMVGGSAFESWAGVPRGGMESVRLVSAFWWRDTPQGHDYWKTLSLRLLGAGHECW
jgi:hypothetical protein